MHPIYRIRQTWHALTAKPDRLEIDETKAFLTPDQFSLFNQLQFSEQSHSIRIYQQMRQDGIEQPDLLKAALLHDVGKNRCPLHLWDRIIIVLGRRFTPWIFDTISGEEPVGWKRPFVVSRKHAEWGARMAAAAGSSQLTVELINRHEQELKPGESTPTFNHTSELTVEDLLALLQQYDNKIAHNIGN